MLFGVFQKEYPLVLSKKQLSNAVPYQGGKTELVFYVEGLHFPDKDFDGLLTINLSLLEPVGKVSEATTLSILQYIFCSMQRNTDNLNHFFLSNRFFAKK